eukprot:CAMPEP_0117550400 /NCGR_PEP_ID=MMETSP0784-20121206/48662_1 /TAXON_ID=39447 /ORGANISM="" /LENGTH=208 /DNA_ID=CAMNT_0005347419 /DNA_START=141 /DNA_END=765 /DNA_ORIENTATION=+
MRSLQLAKERVSSRLDFAPVEFIPFEFDPPGTYPPEGTDWTDYCKGYGEAKAKFLLEEKLPQAFALGSAVGIKFRMDRRIVHTVDVNTALELAQRYGVAEDFVAETLSQHFEHLTDPNDALALRARLETLGVPGAEVDAALSDPNRAARNMERTRAVRGSLRAGVPQFEVRCGGSEDLCAFARGGPTSPEYFENLFELCAAAGALSFD